jgi:chemotaxis response regulator CheB
MRNAQKTPTMNFLVAAIAVSGGGIEDVITFFSALPADANIAFVVVAPLPRERESKLAEIIRRHCVLPVIKAENSVQLQPAHVYVIAENSLLYTDDESLIVRPRKKYEVVNEAIQTLLRSIAIHLKERAVAVILGGMGTSATVGAREIEAHGGYVISKEPGPGPNSDMTRHVTMYDAPNIVLPLEEIVGHLMKIAEKKVS